MISVEVQYSGVARGGPSRARPDQLRSSNAYYLTVDRVSPQFYENRAEIIQIVGYRLRFSTLGVVKFIATSDHLSCLCPTKLLALATPLVQYQWPLQDVTSY